MLRASLGVATVCKAHCPVPSRCAGCSKVAPVATSVLAQPCNISRSTCSCTNWRSCASIGGLIGCASSAQLTCVRRPSGHAACWPLAVWTQHSILQLPVALLVQRCEESCARGTVPRRHCCTRSFLSNFVLMDDCGGAMLLTCRLTRRLLNSLHRCIVLAGICRAVPRCAAAYIILRVAQTFNSEEVVLQCQTACSCRLCRQQPSCTSDHYQARSSLMVLKTLVSA